MQAGFFLIPSGSLSFFLMASPTSLYHLFHKLQLDVVAGAVFTSLWLSHLAKVDIPAKGLVVLGLSVWMIYTLDHLLDARKYPGIKRYQFYQRHETLLLSLSLGLAMLLVYLLLDLPHALLWKGALLSLPILGYQWLVRYLPAKGVLIKEAAVALVYTLGTGIFVWTQAFSMLSVTALLWLFLLAWASILSYSHLESKEDSKEGMLSIVHLSSLGFIPQLIKILLGVAILLFLPLSAAWGWEFALPALGMMGLTALLPLAYPYHRYWGELAFLIPGIWFLLYRL